MVIATITGMSLMVLPGVIEAAKADSEAAQLTSMALGIPDTGTASDSMPLARGMAGSPYRTGEGSLLGGYIISFYVSRQAVGTYKCCDVVYHAPSRGYNFDTEFLNPMLLPPRTPMFRDINTLTFRQLLRPTQ